MANGFAQSFEKAFVPAAKSSSDTTMELVKDRIKKQEEKAAKEATILKAQTDYENLRTFISKKNPQLASDLGQLDVSDMSPDTLNTINKIMAKQIAPEVSKGIKGTFMVGKNPETGLPETRNAITGEVVTDPSQIAGNAAIFKENIPLDEYIARASGSKKAAKEVELEMNPEIAKEVEKAKQEVKLDYPNIDEKGRAAVAAYKFVAPRVETLNTLIDQGLFKDAALVKQITMNKSGDLFVPPGSPLEEAIGLINAIKTTGFNIAGTAFTGTEKQVAFTLLDPTGKSDERYKRDLASYVDIFGSRVESGVGGLREAKKVAGEISQKRSSESAQITAESLKTMTREQKIAALKARGK